MSRVGVANLWNRFRRVAHRNHSSQVPDWELSPVPSLHKSHLDSFKNEGTSDQQLFLIFLSRPRAAGIAGRDLERGPGKPPVIDRWFLSDEASCEAGGLFFGSP